MTSATNLRRVLMLGAASLALAACSDTDISSPGAAAPAPAPAPGPAPAPTPTAVDLVPADYTPEADNIEVTTITVAGQEVEVAAITGTLTTDVTLRNDVGYYLANTVFVGNDAGATSSTSGSLSPAANPDGTEAVLTIPAGTTIYGSDDTSGLVVARGSRIIADGTPQNPIVFTSVEEKLREDGLISGDEGRAEWLGLVLNGFAPINNCNDDAATPGSADCEADGEANSGLYGGGNADDDSGILDYVRVENAGIFFNEEDQSNGIAFQGVGTGTQVSNIQVHNNGDDGVEFFGGTVSATNVVITGASDDAVDWTDGWTGSLQRVLVLQPEGEGDYAIEADNRSTTAPDTTPRSNPTIANFTFIGNGSTNAIRLREGTGATLVNGIVTNFATGLRFGDEATASLLIDGASSVDGVSSTIASHLFNTDDPIVPTIDDQDNDDPADDVTLVSEADILGALQDVSVGVEAVAAPFDFVPGLEATVTAQTNDEGANLFLGSDGNTYAAGETVPDGVDLEPLTETQVAGTAVFDTSTLEGLEELNFIGAFAPSDTVEDNWAAGWTKPGTVFAEGASNAGECPAGTAQSGVIGDTLVCAISGTITSDLTLPQFDNVVYRLSGQVFVGEDVDSVTGAETAVLTIEPGVTIFGDSPVDGLVVSRGSEIQAVGTAAAPIVFTSGRAVRGTADYEADTAQWLGLSLNGRAPINNCNDDGATPGSADCEEDGEGNAGLYGGDDEADDSGSLRYVRVEFAGIFLNEEDQSNGIQFLGTGSGTEVEFVQVHNNGDDGLEFFGGTTNAKYVVVTGARDDAIDWTDGWQGNVQYAIIEHSDSDYAFEGDSRSASSPDVSPRSIPQVANFTIVGDGVAPGARFREGMGGAFLNGIFANTATGIDIDDEGTLDGTYEELQNGGLIIEAHFVDAGTAIVDDSPDEGFDADAVLALIDVTPGDNTMEGFSFYGKTDVGVVPGANEAAVVAYDFTSGTDLPREDLDGFFEETNFIGAVQNADDDWYLGWTVDSEGNLTGSN